MRAGLLKERLVLQDNTPVVYRVTSLTRSATTATVTTLTAHGYTSGWYVAIAGASQSDYNGVKPITVTSSTQFTFTVANSPATPATGTITATLSRNASGGNPAPFVTVAGLPPGGVPAELIPIGATERLQIQAMASDVSYRFRVRRRDDVTPKMRALWTPLYPKDSDQQTLEIHGVYPDLQDRTAMLIEAGRIT